MCLVGRVRGKHSAPKAGLQERCAEYTKHVGHLGYILYQDLFHHHHHHRHDHNHHVHEGLGVFPVP